MAETALRQFLFDGDPMLRTFSLVHAFRRGHTPCHRSLSGQLLRLLLEVSPRIAARDVLLERPDGEAARIEPSRDIVPRERHRDGRAGAAPHRVRRDDRLQVRVAEWIGVYADPARLLAELHRDKLPFAARELLAGANGEGRRVLLRVTRFQRYEHVQASAAR